MPLKRYIYLGLTILSGLALPLTALALLLLFNPYPLLLSETFSVRNRTNEALLVTPVGGVRMASGEHHWAVLPQLTLPFPAAPALRQTNIPVPSGGSVSIRANFDDVSLGLVAARTSDGQEKALMVDENAARGGCCYPPKEPAVVISEGALVAANERLFDAVSKTHERLEAGIRKWYALVAAGLFIGLVIWFSLTRFRSLRKLDEV